MMAQSTPTEGLQLRSAFQFDIQHMSRWHWISISLAAITGMVHLYLFVTQAFLPFLAAGMGFFGIIAAIMVTRRGHLLRTAVYVLAIPFTLAQIGAWISLGMPDFYLGVADKVVQVGFIFVLLYLIRADMKA